ncbi:MAG: YdcF family protein [Oscillospiraceae bacterium]|nr:YdcF family protein [Oscillospiraceae bacterium]
MSRGRKRRTPRRSGLIWAVFAAVLLLLCAVLLLRYLRLPEGSRGGEAVGVVQQIAGAAAQTDSADTVSEEAENAADGAERPARESTAAEQHVQEEGQNAQTQPVQSASDESVTAPDAEAASVQGTTEPGKRYNEQTYQLVTDLVVTMRNHGLEGADSIRALLEELKAADPELGVLWEGIMDYWMEISADLPLYPGVLPDGLPEDDSLCIVVLGFQLMYDGDMAPELEGRCEIALASARKYPNAYIVVTGGGTAAGNHSATEAGVMADWLIGQGIRPERIIVEDRSMTTDQNAVFSCAILAEEYPQIKEVAIVSSDYHVALGSMMFTEAGLLYAYENNCGVPYRVVSNAAYATTGNPEYSNTRRFSSYIWVMADPTY